MKLSYYNCHPSTPPLESLALRLTKAKKKAQSLKE